jgi:hypothetical protein
VTLAYEYIIESGVIVPDTGTISETVKQEYLDTFGADLVTTPNTPQGLLINSEVSARSSVATNNATLTNQINPNTSGGVFLDALMSLTGSSRVAATRTSVVLSLTGVAGTVIPQGAQVKDDIYGNLFNTVSEVTLTTGVVTVESRAEIAGEIPAIAGSITEIVTGVPGWETVNNVDAGIVGRPTQSDEQARIFRSDTLAAQGHSTEEAIYSALYLLEGVRSLKYLQNNESVIKVVEGITMLPHSGYVCIYGGLDSEIAQTYQSKKSDGTDYTSGASNTTVSYPVTMPISGQIIDVRFDRPDLIRVGVSVTVRNAAATQNTVDLVRKAILDYAAGLIPNEKGLRVGTSVSTWELGGAINSEQPSIFVKDLKIRRLPGGDYQYTQIDIENFEIADIQETDIVVTVL